MFVQCGTLFSPHSPTVIKESLALYPPVLAIRRQVQKGARLGKLIVLAKMEVNIPPLALHYNHQIWGDDVYLFKPERFVEGVAETTNNNIFAFLPFGLGPQSCVGMNFVLTETKIALSMILRYYCRLNLSPIYVHSPVLFLGLCPQHGLQIMLQAM